MGLNIPAGPSFQAKDFFGLIQCFGSNEQKQYAKEIQDGIATYEALRAEIRAENSRLNALAADVEAGKADLAASQSVHAMSVQSLASNRAAFEAERDKTRSDLAAEQTRLTALASTIAAQDAAVKAAKEALERDRAAHERKVAEDNAAIDARAETVAAAESALDDRKAKFLAAKEALEG